MIARRDEWASIPVLCERRNAGTVMFSTNRSQKKATKVLNLGLAYPQGKEDTGRPGCGNEGAAGILF